MKTWWKHFKCWIEFGHKWDKTGTTRMMANEMNTCTLCGKYEAGSDGWRQLKRLNVEQTTVKTGE